MYSIALTGGIASGKSTVAECFASLGVPVIDTDIIARELVTPGSPALTDIIEQFGNDLLKNNNELDRKKLRDIVFSNADKRKKLEAILHPRIRTEVFKRANELDSAYCIIVVPLLFETDYPYPVQRVLVVDCTNEVQLSRLLARDSMDEQLARSIIESQIPQPERIKRADDIIDNMSDIEAVKKQVEKLHHQYLVYASQADTV